MDGALQERCEQFIHNRDCIREVFKWDSHYMHPVCANLFCAGNTPAQQDRLKQCRNLINGKVGAFSSFRGIIRMPLACMLSMDPRPEDKMDRAISMYRELKDFFHGSDYLALAAFMLTDLDCTPEIIARGRGLYQRMNKEHPLLTSSEDSIFAVLMAFSPLSDDALISDMEGSFRLLKDRFHDGNCAQTTAQILSMEEGDPASKCERVFALYDALEQNGRKFGKHYELATLAALAMTNADPKTLAMDILDADAFLSGCKGYGFLGIPPKTRLTHAAMIVSDGTISRSAVDQASLTGTLSMIIAQQIATCVIISSAAASSAAAASSH